MFAKVWDVAAKDLRQVVKDRGALIMMFAVPLLLMGLVGSVLSDGFTTGSHITATLPVIDHDHGPAARALVSALRHAPSLRVQMRTDQAAVEKAVRDGDQVGLLIIPAGFSAALQRQHPSTRVTYYAVPNNTGVSAQIAHDTVQGVVQHLAFDAVTAAAITQAQDRASGRANPGLTQQLTAQASRQLASAPPVGVRTVNATGRKIKAADTAVPGYALMFALFAIMAASRTILEEKESGTFKRLLIAPLPPYALLGGKLLAQFLQSVVQISVLFAIGALLFKIDLGASLPALALLIVGTSFAASGLGLILVSFIRSERQVRPVTTLIVLSFSALGGSWWPISVEPHWMQSLAKVTPNAWAMEGFNGLMIFDKGFAQVLPDVAALFVYGAVCLAVAARTFRFQEA